MVCIIREAKKGYAEIYDLTKMAAILGAMLGGILAGIFVMVAYLLFPFIENVVTPFLSPILSPSLYVIRDLILNIVSLTTPMVWVIIIVALIALSPVFYALWKCLR